MPASFPKTSVIMASGKQVIEPGLVFHTGSRNLVQMDGVNAAKAEVQVKVVGSTITCFPL